MVIADFDFAETMSHHSITGDALADAVVSLANTREDFVRRAGAVVADAIDFVLDGRRELNDLEGCEKTFIGTKVEKQFVHEFSLPPKSKDQPLDTVITVDGTAIDLDIKFTLGSTWMIPPEAVGKWCLLIKADGVRRTFSIGVLRMDDANLTKGGNRDCKRSVSAAGKKAIAWIAQAAVLPESDALDKRFQSLLGALENRFERQPAQSLADPAVGRTSGVYGIYRDDSLVYVGKTVNLAGRLRKHARSVADASALDGGTMVVRTMGCNEHLMAAFESHLIANRRPGWNNTGFGSNAHGRGRDKQRTSTWNAMFGREVTR